MTSVGVAVLLGMAVDGTRSHDVGVLGANVRVAVYLIKRRDGLSCSRTVQDSIVAVVE